MRWHTLIQIVTDRSPSIRSVLKRIDRLEWTVLLTMLFVAGAVLAFIELADVVLAGSSASVDRAILLALRDSAGNPLGPKVLQEVMRDITALGSYSVLALFTMLAWGYLTLTRARRAAIALLIAVVGGVILSNLLKWGFGRPRPDLVAHGVQVYTASFPSGHSMMAAVVYLTLGTQLARSQTDWRVRPYLIGSAILVTVLVGISRVYLGVHWPTDVLAGWVVGAGWALFCWLLAVWWQSRVPTDRHVH